MDAVQRNLEAVQAALAERERRYVLYSSWENNALNILYRQGATIEEIADDFHKKEAALDTARMELKALNSLNNVSRASQSEGT